MLISLDWKSCQLHVWNYVLTQYVTPGSGGSDHIQSAALCPVYSTPVQRLHVNQLAAHQRTAHNPLRLKWLAIFQWYLPIHLHRRNPTALL